eukprot:c23562_g1_i1 orf=484-1149(+)
MRGSVFIIRSFLTLHMALDGGRTDSSRSSNRSLHWAPLRSWNLFSGRVRSRLPLEPPPAQLPHSRSLRNFGGEGSRVGSATTRSKGRPRTSEQSRKGGDFSRRDHNQRAQEVGSQRQGGVVGTDEPLTPQMGSTVAGREFTRGGRGASQDRVLEASDDTSLVHSGRPSANRAHHQQQHNQPHHQQHHYQPHHHHHQHHDHHHHHYHYHHLYHPQPRRLNDH